MTVAEVIQISLAPTKIGSVAQLTAEKGLLMLRALSRAVQQWYKAAPTIYREISVSHSILAPRELTVNCTVGSTAVAASTFTAAELAQAVIIAGEPDYPNRVAGTASLRHAIRAASGATSATLYYDCATYADWTIERVVGDPILLDTGRPLSRIARGGQNMVVGSQIRRMDSWPVVNESTLTSSWPTTYDIEPLGHSRVESSDAHLAVRFYPLPSEASTVEMVLSLLPRRYGLLDLQDDTLEIPIPDEQVDLTLLPLIDYEVSRTPLYSGDPKSIVSLREAALQALAEVRAQPSDWGKPGLRIGTKPGY